MQSINLKEMASPSWFPMCDNYAGPSRLLGAFVSVKRVENGKTVIDYFDPNNSTHLQKLKSLSKSKSKKLILNQ